MPNSPGQVGVCVCANVSMCAVYGFYLLIIIQPNTDSWNGVIGCARVCRVRMLNDPKQACLFRALSMQLLMVLIVGLDCRLLPAFSLWVDIITARPTC